MNKDFPDFLKPFATKNRDSYVNPRYNLETSNQELEDHSKSFASVIYTSDDLKTSLPTAVKFILIGIPEDIGVRANMGRPGAAGAWGEFLKSFLALQHTEKNNAGRYCILRRGQGG